MEVPRKRLVKGDDVGGGGNDAELLAADLERGGGTDSRRRAGGEVGVGVEELGAVAESVDAAEVGRVTGLELALAGVGNPVVGGAGVGDLAGVELDGLEDAEAAR